MQHLSQSSSVFKTEKCKVFVTELFICNAHHYQKNMQRGLKIAPISISCVYIFREENTIRRRNVCRDYRLDPLKILRGCASVLKTCLFKMSMSVSGS
mmetsp:Transcript_8035/g.10802  ORF Transcript_8035/g.10802 Transcript_8035/m.10802 type:complete len:97 (-) Transcript_8035:1543-1833(-)